MPVGSLGSAPDIRYSLVARRFACEPFAQSSRLSFAHFFLAPLLFSSRAPLAFASFPRAQLTGSSGDRLMALNDSRGKSGGAGAANAGATGDGGAPLYPWERAPGAGGERPATAGSLDSADFIIRNELPEVRCAPPLLSFALSLSLHTKCSSSLLFSSL